MPFVLFLICVYGVFPLLVAVAVVLPAGMALKRTSWWSSESDNNVFIFRPFMLVVFLYAVYVAGILLDMFHCTQATGFFRNVIYPQPCSFSNYEYYRFDVRLGELLGATIAGLFVGVVRTGFRQGWRRLFLSISGWWMVFMVCALMLGHLLMPMEPP